MSSRTPEPTGGQNAETMKYRAPAKPTAHKHGRATANAQTNQIDVIGPEDHAYGSDVVTRKGAASHGLPSRHLGDRNQSAALDAGDRGPDRRAGAYRDSTDSRKRK
jgi:hypothetical protein